MLGLDLDPQLEGPGREIALRFGEEGGDPLDGSPAASRELEAPGAGIEAGEQEVEATPRLALTVARVLTEVGAVVEATRDLLAPLAEDTLVADRVVGVDEVLQAQSDRVVRAVLREAGKLRRAPPLETRDEDLLRVLRGQPDLQPLGLAEPLEELLVLTDEVVHAGRQSLACRLPDPDANLRADVLVPAPFFRDRHYADFTCKSGWTLSSTTAPADRSDGRHPRREHARRGKDSARDARSPEGSRAPGAHASASRAASSLLRRR